MTEQNPSRSEADIKKLAKTMLERSAVAIFFVGICSIVAGVYVLFGLGTSFVVGGLILLGIGGMMAHGAKRVE